MTSEGKGLQVHYGDGLKPPGFKLLCLVVRPAVGGGCNPFLRFQLHHEQPSDYPFIALDGDGLVTLPEVDEEELNATARITMNLASKFDRDLGVYTVVAVRLEVLGVVGIFHWEGRTAARLFTPF